MEKQNNKTDISRPPVVCILGHVDHGKTTLLDTLRKTRIAQKEAGGITQSIGASEVITKQGKRITFIDTPGHAAFGKMRSRGAKVADIAVLVVAADDGVKPQTEEAIEIIKDSEIPFLIAITKVDLATANIDATLGQLEKRGVFLEKRGGDVPWVEVSVKTNKGIEELLDLISLLAEMKEIGNDENCSFEGVVIESTKDQRGCVVNIIVRSGSLEVGEIIYCGSLKCKVKSLLGSVGSVKKVLPGEAAQVLGFSELVPVGSKLRSCVFDDDSEKDCKKCKGKLDEGEIGVIIKAQNAGALEAVVAGLPEKVIVIDSGIGDVNESDVLLARSSGVDYIIGFSVKVAGSVVKLAEAEGIKIEIFSIIYQLFQKIEDLVKKGQVVEIGRAEIIAEFPFDSKRVAGCKVLTGSLSKNSNLHLIRGEQEIGSVRAISLKKQKVEVNEVNQGEEFGVLFVPQLDFKKGDVLVSRAS